MRWDPTPWWQEHAGRNKRQDQDQEQGQREPASLGMSRAHCSPSPALGNATATTGRTRSTRSPSELSQRVGSLPFASDPKWVRFVVELPRSGRENSPGGQEESPGPRAPSTIFITSPEGTPQDAPGSPGILARTQCPEEPLVKCDSRQNAPMPDTRRGWEDSYASSRGVNRVAPTECGTLPLRRGNVETVPLPGCWPRSTAWCPMPAPPDPERASPWRPEARNDRTPTCFAGSIESLAPSASSAKRPVGQVTATPNRWSKLSLTRTALDDRRTRTRTQSIKLEPR